MLFITTRRTEQKNLIDGSILHMVSMFVVAYDHEIEKFKEDNFKSFLEDARKRGFLTLPGDVKMLPETVEVSYTRKGFLIKCSVTDFLPASDVDSQLVQVTLDANGAVAEVFKPVKGFSNYEFSNKGNLRNVKTGNLVKRDGNRFKVSQDGQAFSLSLGDLEASY